MTKRRDRYAQTPQPTAGLAAFAVRLVAFAAAGSFLLLLAYYARTWQSFTRAVAACPRQFCDFADYYYPMGEAIFRTDLPVPGFLYSPFVAILLAPFSLVRLNTALVLWGVLQVLFVSLYVLLLHRLLPGRRPMEFLCLALTLSSYPILTNLMWGQVSILTTVSLLGLLVFYDRGHRAVAANLLAFAVSFKFYPIIFLASFAARRDTRFLLLAAVACSAFLLVIPGVFLGSGDTLGFYGALVDSWRDSDWVVTNPHSQFFPHVVLRLADAITQDADPLISLLRWIAFGVAAVNMGLVFLVQRARLRHADLWSFQLLFLTIPFVLKTSWPHDFAFLPFSQAFLAWRVFKREKPAPAADAAGERPRARASRDWALRARTAAIVLFLLLSIGFSNTVLFGLFGSYPSYGFGGFLFWADLFLLIASYMMLLPAALRQPCWTDSEDGRSALIAGPGAARWSFS